MIERIGKKLTEILAPIVSLNLSEAETEAYPYAVYDYNPIPTYTKDGIVGYSADVTLAVVSTQFDEADRIRQEVMDSINTIGDGFSVMLQEWSPECVEGIWIIQILFNIKQTK